MRQIHLAIVLNTHPPTFFFFYTCAVAEVNQLVDCSYSSEEVEEVDSEEEEAE